MSQGEPIKHQILDQRPRYFAGRYLLSGDFELQHDYLTDRLRYHHSSLHVSGIVEGLAVSPASLSRSIQISPGSAIDQDGNLIVLPENVELTDLEGETGVIYIAYREVNAGDQQNEQFTRWQDSPVFIYQVKQVDPETLSFFAFSSKDKKYQVLNDLELNVIDELCLRAVKLNELTIVDNQVQVNSQKRGSYSGLRLPSADDTAITLRTEGQTAVLQGSLSVTDNLTVQKDLSVVGKLTLGSQSTDIETALIDMDTSIKQALVDVVREVQNTSVSTDEALRDIRASIDGKANKEGSSDQDFAAKILTVQKVGIGYNDPAQSAVVAINGNVGIGTITPAEKLEVKGNLKAENTTLTGTASVLDIRTVTPQAILEVKPAERTIAGVAGRDMFYTGNKAMFTLGYNLTRLGLEPGDSITLDYYDIAGGRGPTITSEIVGIGSDNSLTVKSDFDEGDVLFDREQIFTAFRFTTRQRSLLCVQDNGNVGVGTPNPSAKLEVNGDIKATSATLGSLTLTKGSTINQFVDQITTTGQGSSAVVPTEKAVREFVYQVIGNFAVRYLSILYHIEFVYIPSGRFLMGFPDSEPINEASNWSKPQHEVTISSFWMSKYPITQAQWKAVVQQLPQKSRQLGSDPSSKKGDRNPVEMVTWEDAQEFCQRLTNKLSDDKVFGAEVRLPSEAEWEYACRAGSTTKFYFGDEEVNLKDYAWYNDNGNNTTHPVGEKLPNKWGLYDMLGNVAEHCQDRFNVNYNGAPEDGSAWVTGGWSNHRVIRGGSWNSIPFYCRSAARVNLSPTTLNHTYGFRVVCVAS